MRVEKKEKNIIFFVTPEEYELAISVLKPIEIFQLTSLMDFEHFIIGWPNSKYIVALDACEK